MGPAAWDAGSSRKHLLNAIDASLRRLNTDYVDLYQLHMDDPLLRSTKWLELWIRSCVRQGALHRRIEFSRLPSGKSAWTQDTLKLTRFVSVQPRYNLLFREVERELFRCAGRSLAVIPFNPLPGDFSAANTNTRCA